MPDQSRPAFYIEVLQSELERRKRANPRYSLRAFSRSLRMDPAALSRVLRGKQALSAKACPGILKRLKLPALEQEQFLNSVLAARNDRAYTEVVHHLGVAERPASASPFGVIPRIPRALYDRLADRYHVAVLELCQLQGFRSEPAWIASQLGMTELHARWVISLLLGAGILLEDDGQLRRAPAESGPAQADDAVDYDLRLANWDERVAELNLELARARDALKQRSASSFCRVTLCLKSLREER